MPKLYLHIIIVMTIEGGKHCKGGTYDSTKYLLHLTKGKYKISCTNCNKFWQSTLFNEHVKRITWYKEIYHSHEIIMLSAQYLENTFRQYQIFVHILTEKKNLSVERVVSLYLSMSSWSSNINHWFNSDLLECRSQSDTINSSLL